MIITPAQTDIASTKVEEETSSWLRRPLVEQLPFITPEILIVALIMVLAVFSRFYILGERVMSHDETNHVVPSYSLYQGEGYKHDPVTHGPFQFHIVALTYFMFGASDFTSRIPAALFSVATVFFAWWGFRRYFGLIGALLAAVLMLISPYILFYGRYTRNEAFVGFSMVVMVYAIFRYLETGRSRFIYVFTLAFLLHFITKETSFIYAAQALIFLAGLVIYQLLRKPWRDPSMRRTFVFGLTAAVILFGLALAAYAVNRPPVPAAPAVTPGQPTSTPVPAPAPAPIPVLALVLGGLALVDLAVASYFLIRGYGIAAIRRERSFDLLILLGTLVLPMLSPFPVKLVGWDPLDYSTTGAIHTAIFIILLTLLAAGIGLWWRPRLWLYNFVLFYAVFITFYTTFFTNGQGFLTGLVGALGYWLSQQGVHRGEQPLYFYALIQIPMYEYLPAIGTLIALVLALRHRRQAQFDAVSSPEAMPAVVPEEVDGGESPNGQGEGLNTEIVSDEKAPLRDWVPFAWFLIFWTATSLAAFSYAGEKMPWLTVHITLPMILVSGWSIGYLAKTDPWHSLSKQNLWLTLLVLPVFLFSLGSLLVTISGNHPPFQGKELAQLQDTLTFLMAIIAAVASLAGILSG